MAEFFRQVWDPEATAESVRDGQRAEALLNPGSTGDEPPTFLFLSDGRVLGYVSSIPTRIWSGRDAHQLFWIKGLMVLPEHRNGPVGYLVLKEAARQIRSAVVLTVNPASRRLFGALGFTDHGALPNDLRLLRPGRVLARIDVAALGLGGMSRAIAPIVRALQKTHLATLAGGAAGLGLRLWATIAGRAPLRLRGTVGALPSVADLDSLWGRARAGIRAGQVRDGAYLHWRYGAGPYHPVTVRDRGELVGVLVLRAPSGDGDPRLRGVRVATIADVLFPVDREDVARTLLSTAERTALRLGADALLCGATAAPLTAILRRRAYFRLPGNVHFFSKDPDKRHDFPAELSSWWLTRGDGESDGTF
jgi:hypothetical protein